MPLPEYADRPVRDLPSALWPHRARLDGAHRDPDRMRRIRALYYGLIGQVDDGIARILAALRELRLEENTVVLFTADHGEMLGDHGLSQKNCPYEPSVRVPLLLRWPRRTRAGTACDDPVGLTDVLPTFVDELGLDYPANQGPLPGESLLGVAGGGLASGRGDYVIDYGQGARRWIAVRTRRHKYALFACNGGREELYDLEADPHERHNLTAAEPELTAAFRERALEWERTSGLARAPAEAASFSGARFRTWPAPAHVPSEEELRDVTVNEGPWPKRVPADEAATLESFAAAFTRAISKEKTLSPDKLSVATYKRKISRLGPRDAGGESLGGHALGASLARRLIRAPGLRGLVRPHSGSSGSTTSIPICRNSCALWLWIEAVASITRVGSTPVSAVYSRPAAAWCIPDRHRGPPRVPARRRGSSARRPRSARSTRCSSGR